MAGGKPAGGKRASMREGPLAALVRGTAELEADEAAAKQEREVAPPPPPEPPRAPEPLSSDSFFASSSNEAPF